MTHDSSISASGSESQTIPPPTQRWIRPSATANVRIVSASSKSPFAANRPEGAHRRAAADRLEARDVIDRGDLRRAGDRPAREGRGQDLRQPDARAQTALDRRDEMRHAGKLVLDHQLGPANRADPADAREIVAFEIDDHHVLGSVLRVVDVLARRPGALDRHRPQPVAAAGEKELGRGGDDRPAFRRRTGAGEAAGAVRMPPRAHSGHRRSSPTGAARG